jgi:hypothetical protein
MRLPAVKAWLCSFCTQLYLVLYLHALRPHHTAFEVYLKSFHPHHLLNESARYTIHLSLMSSLEANEDGVVELARTLSAPEVFEEPVVEIDRNGTPASALRGRTEQKAPCLPISGAGTPAHDQHRSSTYQSNSFNNGNAGVQFGDSYQHVVIGHQNQHVVIGHTINYHPSIKPQPQNQSLFDTLVLQEDHFTGRQSAPIRESKTRYRAGRLVSNFGA